LFVRRLREELFDFFYRGRFKFVEFGRWGRWWRIVGRERGNVAGQDSVTEFGDFVTEERAKERGERW
jgi:hypothetical protein